MHLLLKILKISLPILFLLSLSIFVLKETQTTNLHYAKQIIESLNEDSNNLKMMTYNIRSSNLDYGRHSWSNRRELIKNKINEFSPDIVGTQEGLHNQLKDLELLLPEYRAVGYLPKIETNDRDNENLVILYKYQNIHLLDSQHFWLSDTPNEEFSNTWGAKYPRIAVYALFRIKATNFDFAIINTHYDHKSKYARIKSSELIKNFLNLKNLNVPIFLMGDFNDLNNSSSYDVFTNDGYKDPFDECSNSNIHLTKSTFHNYFGKIVNYPVFNVFSYFGYAYLLEIFPSWKRFHIDWILYKNSEKNNHISEPLYAVVCEDYENYLRLLIDLINNIYDVKNVLKSHLTYASDHYPVYSEFKIKNL